MNKKLYKKEISTKIKSIKVLDQGVSITFDEGSVVDIKTFHEQDCCENVYGDFTVFKNYIEQLLDKNFTEFSIKAVEEIGFIVNFEGKYSDALTRVLVPCYNFQNGYYSSQLKLSIVWGGVESLIDISDLVEHHID